MKIKNYNLFLESNKDIDAICKKYGIKNYTINSDGSVDVNGDVDLEYRFGFKKKLDKLPLKFGRVSGNFNCRRNNLTSLEGSPNWVGGDFACSSNGLTNLIGGPEMVIGYYSSSNNKINDFIGFPDDFEGNCIFFGNPVQKILDEFPRDIPTWKVTKYILEYEAIWDGKVIPERMEMVKDILEVPHNYVKPLIGNSSTGPR
jgi:hypothetical protein